MAKTSTERFQQLLKRAVDADLKAEVKADEAYEGVEEEYLDLEIQAGRTQVHLRVEADDVDNLAQIPFEQLRFVDGYYAVYCPAEGWIEVLVESVGHPHPLSGFRRLHRLTGGLPRGGPSARADDLGPINVADSEREVDLRIGAISEVTKTLLDLSELTVGDLQLQRGLSLKIEGLELERHDGAVKAIQGLANAFLFEIELMTDIAFHVPPQRGPRRPRWAFAPKEKITLDMPRIEYDADPLSLYWYSRVAEDMPLLQFLALYQCIEYYFPVYSAREAQQVLRTTIKDPRFNFDRDIDVATLLQDLRISRGGGYGSEVEQLISVVETCALDRELLTFLSERDDRKEFYANKDSYGVISKIRVPLGESASDRLQSIAKRLYDIRCRIVHSKADQDHAIAVILPFSKEAQMLTHDIALARFVARKTLVASGTALRI